MTEVATFHASTRRSIFSDLASSPRPLNLAVYPDGAVQSLAPVVELKVGAGRLLGASAPGANGVDALVRVALAESGRIEIRAGALPDRGPDAFPEFETALDEADRKAQQLTSSLWPLGGLNAVFSLSGAQLTAQAGRIPPEAMAIAEMCDGRTPVATVLSRSVLGDRVSVTVLGRLVDAGILLPSGTYSQPARPVAPSSPAPAVSWTGWNAPASAAAPPADLHVRPSFDSALPIPEADSHVPHAAPAPLDPRAPVMQAPMSWPPEPRSLPHEPSVDSRSYPPPASASYAPPASQSYPAPAGSFEQAPQPAERVTVPAPSAPPPAAPEPPRAPSAPPPAAPTSQPVSDEFLYSGDDDIDLAQAGLGDRQPLIIGAVALLALMFVIVVSSQESEEEKKPPTPAPVAVVAPVVTPTVAAPPPPPPPPPPKQRRVRRPRYSLSNPPPVAGPRADERLKSAERLLRQGELEAAEEQLGKLRRQLPRDSAVWVLSGMASDQRGDLQSAMSHVKKALRVNRKSYRAWVLKGWLEQSENKTELALASYRKALEIEPGHAMSRELRKVAEGLEGGGY